ncbi:hypothetical protein BJV77DRAFT_777670 [Russula vinacea]|nr:hypothetical protein BJV77DRAFT_777670 [Russula vinacea]
MAFLKRSEDLEKGKIRRFALCPCALCSIFQVQRKMVSAGLDTAPRSADTLVHDLNTKSSSEMSGHLLCVQRSYEEIKREISICSEFKVRSVSAARFISHSGQTDRSWWDSAAFLRDVRFTFFSNSGFVPVQFKDYVPKVRLKVVTLVIFYHGLLQPTY